VQVARGSQSCPSTDRTEACTRQRSLGHMKPVSIMGHTVRQAPHAAGSADSAEDPARHCQMCERREKVQVRRRHIWANHSQCSKVDELAGACVTTSDGRGRAVPASLLSLGLPAGAAVPCRCSARSRGLLCVRGPSVAPVTAPVGSAGISRRGTGLCAWLSARRRQVSCCPRACAF